VTVVPDVPLGTANVQLKDPVPSVVSEPLEQRVTTTLSKVSPTELVTEKPVPATVAAAPTGPWPGVTVIAGVVTVNEPVAVWPPESVAVTVVPEVPLGTAKVQENAPEASVDNEPLVQLLMVTPSNTSEARVVDTEKPVPDTVTVAPIGPCVGLTRIAGMVRVNVPVAVWPPASVATTDVPEVPLGTAIVHEKAPLALAVNEPLVQLEIDTLSKTSEASAVDTEKPVPETVVVEPTGPWSGVTVIAGVVTVNVPDAVSPPESVAVTVVPVVPLGTANAQLNVPVPLVIREPLEQLVIATPSNTNDAKVVEPENPVPETVTAAPTGPCAGLTVIIGVAKTMVWPTGEPDTVKDPDEGFTVYPVTGFTVKV
jgi:hypothetical protein